MGWKLAHSVTWDPWRWWDHGGRQLPVQLLWFLPRGLDPDAHAYPWRPRRSAGGDCEWPYHHVFRLLTLLPCFLSIDITTVSSVHWHYHHVFCSLTLLPCFLSIDMTITSSVHWHYHHVFCPLTWPSRLLSIDITTMSSVHCSLTQLWVTLSPCLLSVLVWHNCEWCYHHVFCPL